MQSQGGSRNVTVIMILALAVIMIAAVERARADDFILNPGYVEGTINLPGHEVTGGSITAAYKEPGAWQWTTISTTSFNGNSYRIVVEGGDREYVLTFQIRYDGTGWENRFAVWRYTSVAVGNTVTVNIDADAAIEGTIVIENETIERVWISVWVENAAQYNPAENFQSRYTLYDSGQYSIPVMGGAAEYGISFRGVNLADVNGTMQLKTHFLDVTPGQVKTFDVYMNPAYLEGTVVVTGAILEKGSISAMAYDEEDERYYRASLQVSQDGTFRCPLYPGLETKVEGTIYTNFGPFKLEEQFVDTFEGQTTYCEWVLDIASMTGTVSGNVSVQGMSPETVRVWAMAPPNSGAGGRLATVNADGDYLLEGLIPGQWRLATSIRDETVDPLTGYADEESYSFPEQSVDVQIGQESVVDFFFNPGFIEGRLLSENSGVLQHLASHTVAAWFPDYNAPDEYASTSMTDDVFDDGYDVNQYDMFVRCNDWKVQYVNMGFKRPVLTNSPDPEFPFPQYKNTSVLGVRELNRPSIPVGPGQTVQYDFGYETAQIIAILRTATGEVLSNPNVKARTYVTEERTVYVQGLTNAVDVMEGLVVLDALPGTYELTAFGVVQNTKTQFGQPFEVTVGEGDTVLIDPNAPFVEIFHPPGFYESSDNQITTYGTVTDESGVALFRINGVDVPLDNLGQFSYTVLDLEIGENVIEYYAEDVHGNSITIKRTIYLLNTAPHAEVTLSGTAQEGSEIFLDGGTSHDPEGDPLQYRWDFDNDGTWDTGYSYEPTATYTWQDDFQGDVVLEVFDGFLTDTGTLSVVIANAAPAVESIELSTAMDPVSVSMPVDLTGRFTDPGVLDSHTWSLDWGDGEVTTGTVANSNGDATLVESHVYSQPDVYTITLTVTDDDGGIASRIYQYVVVYDPGAGFVTGGGKMGSSGGAYPSDPLLSGQCNFGFVAKYQNGNFVPMGNTEFHFKAGDLRFHSSVYEWLVVSGGRAQYKGSGSIKHDSGEFGFLLTVIDGSVGGSGGVDRFRIKIWDRNDSDVVIYDNNPGMPDDGFPTTPLSGGNIMIHH